MFLLFQKSCIFQNLRIRYIYFNRKGLTALLFNFFSGQVGHLKIYVSNNNLCSLVCKAYCFCFPIPDAAPVIMVTLSEVCLVPYCLIIRYYRFLNTPCLSPLCIPIKFIRNLTLNHTIGINKCNRLQCDFLSNYSSNQRHLCYYYFICTFE